MSSLSQSRRAAFVTSRPSFVSAELRPLVQSRLRLAGLVGLVTVLIIIASELLLNANHTSRVYLTVAVEGVNAVVFGVGALLLFRVPEMSLERLRVIETIAVVTFAASASLAEYFWLIGGNTVATLAGNTPETCKGVWWILENRSVLFSYGDGAMIISIAWAFPWTVLLNAYTGWIPTTLRRSLTLTAIIFALAFAATVGAAITHRPLAVTYLSIGATMLLFMTPMTVLGLTSAHKLDGLRRQAYEAKRLGQYTLERKLGEGGMGEVYLARHRFLRRPCAVKLIRTESAEEHSSLVRFEREVQAMAALTHPNTVEIFDYGRTEEGTFYYVMEYLPGLSLDELTRRYGALPPSRVVHLLQQVCAALTEAHAVGLLHRDIKPSNILLCERGRRQDVAKLLDFGLVQRIGEQDEELQPSEAKAKTPAQVQSHTPASEDALGEKVTLAGSLVGTPAYMSPEQVIGNRPLDARSDIYSLGGVAYHLLTGRPPFTGRSTMEMMAAHLAETVDPLQKHCADVPVDLQAVVMRCLEKDPNQRFPDAASLSLALAACACAGKWTQDDAAAWWRQHGERKSEAAEGQAAAPGGLTIEAAELVVDSVSVAKS